MRPIKINVDKLLMPAERFFVEKSVELLYRHTIDTYRLRINNSRTILEEIVQVLGLIETKTIRDFYGTTLLDEAREILAEEEELSFISITKPYLLKLLSGNDYSSIFYACNILLKENCGYCKKVADIIYTEIVRLNALPHFDPKDFKNLNRLIGSFYIELKSIGYSKNYLHHFVRSIFSPRTPHSDFKVAFDIICSLINRPKEKFAVYMSFMIPDKIRDRLKIEGKGIEFIEYDELLDRVPGINNYFEKFIKDQAIYGLYKIEVECQDYLSAGYLARQKLQLHLDVLFMGYSTSNVRLSGRCFVVGERNPKKGNTQNLHYRLDGFFASNQEKYIEFLDYLTILNAKSIDHVSQAKLYSGLRYLRLGTVSTELENKLLNYWIAIEYLFSSIDGEQDKVKRLRDNFKKIHSVSYATQLFQDLHESVQWLSASTILTNFNKNDLNYLSEHQTLTELSQNINSYPLLVYRIFSLQERFGDAQAIKKELERHQKNLERNIIRIYRLRNEIVHSAAKEKNIQEITAHLRYYVTFVINGFIDFALTCSPEINRDGKISLDDYYTLTSMQLDNLLIGNTISLKTLLKIKNPIHFLTEEPVIENVVGEQMIA